MIFPFAGTFCDLLLIDALMDGFKVGPIIGLIILTPFIFFPILMINQFYPYYILVYPTEIVLVKRNVFKLSKFIIARYSLKDILYSYHFGKGVHLVEPSIYRYHLVPIYPSDNRIEKKKEEICRTLERCGIRMIKPNMHEEWITDLSKSSKEMKSKTTIFWAMKDFSPDYEYGIMKMDENVSQDEILDLINDPRNSLNY
jgi:hypothetical protein